jgi:hypothetical protein
MLETVNQVLGGASMVEQISVFLENKAGRLSEVTGILYEANINIRALSLADTSDFGVLRLIVDNNTKAVNTLKENGFTVGRTEVIAVEVTDKPGGLHNILELLRGAGLNVEYMYSYVRSSRQNAVMIFRLDNVPGAIDILQQKNVAVLDSDQLNGI